MREYGRYRLNSGNDCNEGLHRRTIELKSINLRTIKYIIKENLTIEQGKESEKILVPLIGRQNHPDPNNRGNLLNLNNGGDGFAPGELAQEIRTQMGESRRGNRNRCDKWLFIRVLDGHERIIDNFVATCKELDLNKDRMYEYATGRRKSPHRGWTCENLTRRKAVGGAR